jgi:hypothetical protein
MEKYLIPGAIVVAAIIFAGTFRYETHVFGGDHNILLIRDRWSGEVKYCGGPSGSVKCFPYLTRGYRPYLKKDATSG